MEQSTPRIRIIPESWLSPLPLEEYFEHPEHPVEVDVGCGKGRFLLARATRCPEINYLGIDRMLRRIRKIDNRATRQHLFNIRLLRVDAYYAVSYLVPLDSVSTYYLFFPDPWPKKQHHKYRLMQPRFMDALHQTLKVGGQCHFVTDHPPYYEETVEVVEGDDRFEIVEPFVPTPEESTDFELYYMNHTEVHRCSFRKR